MNDLIVVEQINAVQVFDGKSLDPLLEKITAQVKEFKADTSTAKGRKEIASLANKIAKSKTFLESAGKELVSGWKSKAKVVDAERKKMRDYLDNLKVETRKPLTDWEVEEEARQKDIYDKIFNIKIAVTVENEDYSKCSAAEMAAQFEILKNTAIDESFGDMVNEAAIEKEKAIRYFDQVISARIEYEKGQAELERLRLEAEARKKADEEERLRREGEERARIAAEAKAKAERERVALEAKEKAEAEQKEHDRIEAEKQAAIDAQIEAERKAKEADERAIRQAEQAEQDKINAQKKAAADAEKVRLETIEREAIAKERARVEAENAAKVERDRIERERQAEIEAAKKREADKAHKAKINNAAKDALAAIGLDCDDAKNVIIAIASGKIPHVKISY